MSSRTSALAGSLILHAALALLLSIIRFAAPTVPRRSQPITLFPAPLRTEQSVARVRLRPPSRLFVAPRAASISIPAQTAPPRAPVIAPAAPAAPVIAAVELPAPVPSPPPPAATAYATATLAPAPRSERRVTTPTATFAEAAAKNAGDHAERRLQIGSFDQAAAGPSAATVSAAHASGLSAGFDASPPEHTPERSRRWKSSGFSDLAMAAPADTRRTAPARRETALEILSKPRPIYSDAGRRLGLEGDVLLEAAFQASGQVHVLRVIHGLGHGLDENAVQAASGIRFRPATVNGSAVDMVATVRITFQLAN